MSGLGAVSCPAQYRVAIAGQDRKPCGRDTEPGRMPDPPPSAILFFGRSIYGNSFSSDVSRILEKITKMPSIEHLHLFDPDVFKEFAKHHKEL